MLAAPAAYGADETMYVQAVKIELKGAPQMNAAKVADLKRGDELKVLKKDGLWYQVKSGASLGFISKMFVSPNKPVGNADLNADVQVSLEKTSRRRSSSYSVSASTRGLSADARVRDGREMYRSDYEALKEVEGYEVKKGDLDNFQRSAKLISN
jgi:hypothetical protein